MGEYLHIEIKHLVNASIFAKALADHFWINGEEFDSGITKTRAEIILRNSLEHRGGIGIPDRDRAYRDAANTAALEWIKLNYPSLY